MRFSVSAPATGFALVTSPAAVCVSGWCLQFWEDARVAISRDEVLHVARLARLDLTEEEIERFREQLNAILEAVGKVAELDLSDVEPTAHPLDLVNVWAEDEPRPSLTVEEALANAPDRDGALFRVPAG